ncbi:hypothetical protein KIN34_05630 [Cellulomonas sp. DKR-3]|uniref:DUF2238 domain-containing protein n=1 Tax=Cellulomonas fulva TaxID=2835530 RepID=A0ABS5TX86_9CELL|nr:hypothetical protein [Cellulomonas fulva]MBT0993765.1 hypothetical protein [Cellulomonas fulva]
MTRNVPVRALLDPPVEGAVRVAVLVSIVLAVLVRGPVGAALFLLVAAGMTVPRLARAPGTLGAAYGVGLLAAAWCGALDLYEAVWWLDGLMHLVVTGLVAAVAHLLLARRTGAVVDPSSPAAPAACAAVTLTVGLALSAVWELAEYAGHTYLDPSIYVAYGDTIADMALGGLGSAVAGAALLRVRRRPATS